MNLAELGNTIYIALCDDPDALAAIRAERASLALTLATDPASSAQVTSSTVNGQSFATTNAMSQGNRLKMLSWICRCQERGSTISTTALTYFST